MRPLHDWPEPTLPAIIDSTMLSDFRTCPMKFAWRHIYKITPAGSNIHLRAGGAFAAGIQAARMAYWKYDASTDEALYQALITATIEYGPGCLEEGDDEHQKSLRSVWLTLEGYLAEWPLETDHLRILDSSTDHPAVEFSFAVPITRPSGEPVLHPVSGDPYLFAGRIDCIVERDGLLFTLDEKTTKYLGPKWAVGLEMRGQFIGYNFAAIHSGLPEPQGWIVRKIKFPGPRSEFEYREYMHLMSEWRMKEWHEDLCLTLDQISAYWKAGHYTKVWNDSCTLFGGCDMLALCTTPEPSDVLVPHYKFNEWTPLAHEKVEETT